MIGRVLAILILAATGLVAQVSHDKLVFVVVDPAGACANRTAVQYNPLTGNLWGCKNLVWTNIGASGAGSGTVTSFSAGTLSPLFTTSVATATTTPALSFVLTNAGAGTVFGNRTGSSGAPAYTAVPVLGLPGTTIGTLGLAGNTSGSVTITPQAAAGTPTLTLPNASGTFAVSATSPLSLSATTGALTCSTCQTAATTVVHSFGSTFDGSGSALTTGTKAYFTVPYGCTIQAWNATVDTGTITFDIWKIATGSAIPTVSNTITASALPAISSGTALHSTTLTAWTTTVTANDIIAVNVNAVASATKASLAIQCQ